MIMKNEFGSNLINDSVEDYFEKVNFVSLYQNNKVRDEKKKESKRIVDKCLKLSYELFLETCLPISGKFLLNLKEVLID